MKKIVVIVGMILFGVNGFAQSHQPMHQRARLTPERRAALQTETMQSHLKLDAAQKAQLMDINLRAAREMEPVISERADQSKRLRELEHKRIDQYKRVLTPQQMNQYEELRRSKKTRR